MINFTLLFGLACFAFIMFFMIYTLNKELKK